MNEADTKTTGHRLRKAWVVWVDGYDDPGYYFGPTAGKVRSRVRNELEADVSFSAIRVLRAQERDVRLPLRDPMADLLSPDETHCLLHAFGANNGNPEKAGYRDYFYTNRDNPTLVALTERGLMNPMDGDKWGDGMTYFVMTDLGKRVALSITPTYRA